MILIDSNILVYTVNTDSPWHSTTKDFVDRLWNSQDLWCLTWVNIYEFLAVSTNPRHPNPLLPQNAFLFIQKLLTHPRLRLLTETERHLETLESILIEAGPVRGIFYHDCHIAALMKEHGVSTIATADTEFRKFRFLKIIDPTGK